ncbi:treslin [Cebus imitator]|uniref:treslin n=1 Tax=Cebus imitator TaxID=2715852 RepID=UPI000809C17E|nr:treslin [Cebus imitator]
MASCHKVMLLLDTAGGAACHSRVRRAALRLLTYLSCRFGLARVHWAFKFFDSQGARSRPSRVSDFRELGARSWEDFEEELEARLEDRAHLPGPAPRATHTHGALMETLLDYQWDRPEITSPAKPILRSSGRRLLDADSEAREAEATLGGLANAVFLLAPCPHSQRELLQFVSGSEAQAQSPPPAPKQVMEKLLPRRVQEVMLARKITFYWVDTIECSKLWESPDHLGYWTVCELLHHGGGTVLPSESFSWDFAKAGEMPLRGEQKLPSEPRLSPWISTLPTDATLNRLLYNSPEYEASFPQMEGMLFLPIEAGKEIQETWTVTLGPLAMHQRHFQKPVRIFLKGSVAQWSLPTSSTLGTDSWMLQSAEESVSTQRLLFQQLVSRLTAEELHLVADVDPGEGWPPVTGVISPLSANAMVLTVFRTKEAEFQRHVLQMAMASSPQDTASLLFSDVVDGVLNQTHDSLADTTSAVASPVPEWVQQELDRTTPWSPAVVEKWFPFCNISGASSDLMESFGLLQAASANKEEFSKTEGELTHCLAELYQRKFREEFTGAHQEDSKKKRGVPRTPVRQKMNTMCRSLKMLNVARLNVKAQKLHPDGSPDVAAEKGTQKIASGRTADKLEDRGRTLRSSKPKDFKTEEELLSYICENYQKTVATGEITLYSCARNMISTIKMFLKSKGTKELEVNCLNQVKSNLLKTSKSLRQNLGKKLVKEDKVRECQLQVFLRLEMCLQCPSINESPDDMEQVVEEVTDLLRMVCLTEDSAYLAQFLEEILRLYIDSIPKTLGNLYNSLGFVIPQKLAGVLPTDFFSDDSMTQENKSPLLSVPFLSSARRSVSGSTESDELEDLRTRSAKKRRKNALIRHKSIAEVSQNLRQIEIPKVSKRAMKKENSHPAPQQPSQPVKDTVQEVTKVRRNLFNQEMLSPSKRSLKRGFPRSHSVSAVEGLEDKLDNFKKTKGYHKLLTKSVAETPVHKQISKRLLHRQIKGRSSDPGPDIGVVEESPEKGNEISLRRSPRIKQLSFNRTHSASFYSLSQPKSRSVQRVHSFQEVKSDQRENSPVQSIQSPKSLLFGAVSEMIRPSEKGSARMKRRSRSTLGSEIPAAYQTPKKSHQKSLSFAQTSPRSSSHTPQTPSYIPERPQKSPAKKTPTKQATLKESLKDSSSHFCESPLDSKITPQKRCTQAGESTFLETKIPRTPKRQGTQLPRFSPNCTWPHSVDSSPESPSCAAAPTSSIAQPRRECLSPFRDPLRTPPRAAAFIGTPQNQTHQQLHVPRAAWAEEPPQKLKNKAIKTPERPGNSTMTSSPPVTPKKLFTAPLCDISKKSPFGKSKTESPSPGELDGKEPPMSPSVAASLSCPVPSTPPRLSQSTTLDTIPPPPPCKAGKWCRKTSGPRRSILECQPSASATPGVGTADSPAATTDSRDDQKQLNLSPHSPERRSYPGPGLRNDWHASSPLLITSDTEYLTLLSEAERHDRGNLKSNVSSVEEGEGLRTADAEEKPSLSHPGIPPSPPSCGPGSPLMPSCDLRCTTDRRQCQALAQLDNLPMSDWHSTASASPQTYEVELQMQASGLPKLRIKKIGPSSVLEAEPLSKEESSLGEESILSVLSVPRVSRSSGKPEPTYVSPPCLRLSHSTPGKSGGQTYICQACTPTHGPSSTPSPFQTDGVPWTPSPKHSGKTTPDIIKDWPRRKRAGGCSTGSSSGRGEVGADFPGSLSLLEPESKEHSLELSMHQMPILEDFELEGVCQLPDQSPPKNSVPKAEEAASWGQFGLSSRKRVLLAKEDDDHGAKRICDLREDSEVRMSKERSPSQSARQLPSTGDDEVFVSGSTPPPSCTLKSCLSASALQTLTQSPLLFQGKTPSSQSQDPRDEDVDVFPSTAEDSPFSRAFSRRRPISRTYTRKKLLGPWLEDL